MNKAKVNFVIDAVMTACLLALLGTGMLIKYVLLPGPDRWAKYQRNVSLYFWGMDRHEWGSIHLKLAYVLVALLVLHVILHWRLIGSLYKRLMAGAKLRALVAVVFATVCIVLAGFPALVRPEVREGGHEHGLHEDGSGHGAGERRGRRQRRGRIVDERSTDNTR